MKIAFHDNSLCLRGTTIALYDYAYYTRKILGNESIILYNKKHHANSDDVINKFKKEFEVFGYDDLSEIDEILSKNSCDYFFMIKHGRKDGVISNVCKNLVLAVGECDKNDIHGDKFAFCSDWLSEKNKYEIPVVPHMIDLPEITEDMRKELNIPQDDLVIGRNGGWETFDINWVKDCIKEILEIRKDIWFIFQFTEPFIKHERVIYLPGSSDMKNKVKFINSCNAMIHARMDGESFGLSCGEFSIKNKPVITFNGSTHLNHIKILGDKGIYYSSKEQLFDILNNMDVNKIKGLDWNCYSDFLPEKVIKKFKQYFL